MNAISPSRLQQEIESRGVQMMNLHPDPNRTIEELYGPIDDWIFKLGPYTLLFLPINGTWIYFDSVHENWERTGYKAGQVVFSLEEDQFQAIPVEVPPVSQPTSEPATPATTTELPPASSEDITSEFQPVRQVEKPVSPSEATHIATPLVMWKIDVLTGPNAGKVFSIGEGLSLGRELDNDLSILDKKISRHHATITRQGDSCLLTDLGSINGTFLNGVRLSAPAILKNGDTIVMGDTEMKVTNIGRK